MKPIPVSFNIWKLKIHTYGIGLAITFWFAYRYFARRLRAHGYPDQWLGRAFVWIIVASIIVPIIANGFRGLGIVYLGYLLDSAQAAAARTTTRKSRCRSTSSSTAGFPARAPALP